MAATLDSRNSGQGRPLPRNQKFLGVVALAMLVVGLRAADMPAGHPVPAKPISAADLAFFETKVRPVLVDNCYKCHSKEADKVKGGFLIDTREAMLHGGNTGPAIVPGKPDESLLIQAIRYKDEDLQMPPKGEKLTDQQIADLTEWVRRGAPDPRTIVMTGATGAKYGGVGKQHWAFQPVKKPTVPTVQNTGWVKNPIDNFVLAKLEANGMTPNAPADKATLIRRVYFDLIGLPPHPAEVMAFTKDNSPDALAKVVDKLLASPQYGEHWARYWLDVARYADTKGDAQGQNDLRYPHAWTYRDWVIDAFNADLPYDKFIIAQIAGDYYTASIENQQQKAAAKKPAAPAAVAKPKPASDGSVVEMAKYEVNDKRIAESRPMLAAQGFLTLGNQFNGRRDDIIGDQIDVTTKAFLGLTVACARCHDHKFDPIPTKDYYSLYGVFANSLPPPVLPTLYKKPAQTPEFLEYMEKAAALEKREKELKEEQAALRAAVGKNKAKGKTAAKEMMAKIDPQKRQQLQRAERELYRDINNLETQHPGAPARAHALYDVQAVNPRQMPRDYPVLLRGEVGNRGDIVPRRFLEILSPDPKKRPEWKKGSGRLELALAIADPKNPLTARVFVNRMWQQHWGVGFVETPDDLGNMSSTPTHPELLDWLSATFVENKWSIKSLHRAIVLSAAYQQSGQTNPAYAEKDPNNKLLWRFNLRRLDFEELHDSLLAITGELNLKYGGKPVAINTEEFAKRRSIYTLIDRANPPELLTQFDFPSPDVASGRRYETLVPQQALFLMNSPMVIETARKLVDRPQFADLKSDEERVTLLYLAIFQRWPTKREVELGLAYVKSNPAGTDVALTSELPPAQVKARDNRVAAKQAIAAKQKGRFNTQVGGVYDIRPLDAWTKLAHALFQSNEAMFYN
jgi:mono/diheme cytochrome c family protein